MNVRNSYLTSHALRNYLWASLLSSGAMQLTVTVDAIDPSIKIIAAWRNDKWTLDSRESEIEYCKQHGIHLPFSADSSYSRDRNLWHLPR